MKFSDKSSLPGESGWQIAASLETSRYSPLCFQRLELGWDAERGCKKIRGPVDETSHFGFAS